MATFEPTADPQWSMMTQWMLSTAVPLDGAFNFRDLGGLSGRDGEVTRRGRLFRSDGLHRV